MNDFQCPTEHAHGVNHTCYTSHHCHCAACRANAAAGAVRRRKMRAYGRWESPVVPCTGTRRRVQALMTIGWSQKQLADRLGMDATNFSRLLNSRSTGVLATTRARVAAVYAELWQAGPAHDTRWSRQSYSRARNYAAARRWLPPLAWDDIDEDITPPLVDTDPAFIDEAAVELVIAGEDVPLTSAERQVAVRRLNESRWNDREIAARLQVDDRTVLRIRQRLGIPAAIGHDGLPLTDQERNAA